MNLPCVTLSLTLLSLLGVPGVPVEHLCQHSGVCINAGNTHHCQCPLGYTGSYCEEQLDECASNPCQHGATCSDFIGGYRCEVRRWLSSAGSKVKKCWLPSSAICVLQCIDVYPSLVLIVVFGSQCFYFQPYFPIALVSCLHRVWTKLAYSLCWYPAGSPSTI